MKRLRFTLKTLVYVVTLCAVIFGWWVDHRKLVHALQDKERAIAEGKAVAKTRQMQISNLRGQLARLQAFRDAEKRRAEEVVIELLSIGAFPKGAVIMAGLDRGIRPQQVIDAADRLGVVAVEDDAGPMWMLPR
jgi:hypothetical protein